jgi:lipopolysaccharide transport system permease protein
MHDFPATPKEMVASLWRNRELITASAKREVVGRYKGSVLGLLWSFFTPVLMLAVYTFVFSVIFNARWSSNSDSRTEFALVLFAGLIVFNLFSECVSRAPSLIIANPNYVKKILFPLEILPFVALLSALYHALISLAVWLLAYVALFGAPRPTVFLLPLVIIPFSAFLMGICWALASLGVYLRDVTQFIGVLVTILMFMSPIFYPASALPDKYRDLLYFNPLTAIIEITRDLLYWGAAPEFWILAISWVLASLIAWFGFAWFQKTRRGFADVL